MFNGVANFSEQPLLKAKVGEGIAINIENNTRWPHSMHLHGQHFIAKHPLIDEEIWQDTVLMTGRQKIPIRFVANKPGKWLLHCHMIEHRLAVGWPKTAFGKDI
jgi:FtsP/CotA-like multicopper oxidase with cupredoxin domain